MKKFKHFVRNIIMMAKFCQNYWHFTCRNGWNWRPLPNRPSIEGTVWEISTNVDPFWIVNERISKKYFENTKRIHKVGSLPSEIILIFVEESSNVFLFKNLDFDKSCFFVHILSSLISFSNILKKTSIVLIFERVVLKMISNLSMYKTFS